MCIKIYKIFHSYTKYCVQLYKLVNMIISSSVLHEPQSPICLLTEEEVQNPEQVFTSFFETFDLQDTREQLEETLSLVVKHKFQHREYSLEEDNTRFFFEKLVKVMEAAYLKRGCE